MLTEKKLGILLVRLLEKHGWEISNIELDTDWWAEEYWEIRSVRKNFGLTIILNFLVYFEDIGDWKGKPVNCITASLSRADCMSPRDDDIAVMYTGSQIDANLVIFIGELNHYRDQL